LTEGNNDNQNKEQVANNDNSPFRSGGLRGKRILETSLGDSHNTSDAALKGVTMPADSGTDKSSTSERKTKQEGHVGQS
jgi:hypothetical protein